MKTVRPEFEDKEYVQLKNEADRLGVSVKQLVRDRALGIITEDKWRSGTDLCPFPCKRGRPAECVPYGTA